MSVKMTQVQQPGTFLQPHPAPGWGQEPDRDSAGMTVYTGWAGSAGHRQDTAAPQPIFTVLTFPLGKAGPQPRGQEETGCGQPLLKAQCCAGHAVSTPVSTHKATAQG